MFSLSMYGVSFFYRHQAGRLLECARLMQPGVTTQLQFAAAFAAFDKYLGHGSESAEGKPTLVTDCYGVTSYPL